MAVTLLVKGTIAYGRLREFCQAVGPFVDYRKLKNWAVPEVLHGLSGPMNTVLMVFRYPSLDAWERECAAEREDADYARIASAMPYLEGSIHYELYQ